MDYTPVSSPDSDDVEVIKDDEDEGELDSAGWLFLDLINNEATRTGSSTDNPTLLIPDPADPAPSDIPGPQPAEPPTAKRTRATVIKVPYSRFSNYMMNNSQTKDQPQEKEAEANKKRRTQSSTSQESLSAGIPRFAPSRRVKQLQKTPSTSHPLAGKIRAAKFYS